MTEKNLKEGIKAPAFKLPDADGNTVSLADYKGKWLVLYFYPKDNTSGCTTEALDFTANLPQFRELNAEVVGISPDSCKSHQKFISNHSLAVRLLSDESKEVLQKYGVWQKKQMYGKEYFGVVRSTFLIDPDGKIKKIWEKVKVAGHIEEVMTTLRGFIEKNS